MSENKGPKFDKNGFPVDQDSVCGPFLLFLFILGMIVFYMVFDGFNAATRMPWG